MMVTKKKLERTSSDETLRKKYGSKSQEMQQKDQVKSSKETNNNVTSLGINAMYGNSNNSGIKPNSSSKKDSHDSSKEVRSQIKLPKKNFRRRRRATLADLRYIDIPNTIPECEEEQEEDYGEFSMSRLRRSKSNDDINLNSRNERKMSFLKDLPFRPWASKTETASSDVERQQSEVELENVPDNMSESMANFELAKHEVRTKVNGPLNNEKKERCAEEMMSERTTAFGLEKDNDDFLEIGKEFGSGEIESEDNMTDNESGTRTDDNVSEFSDWSSEAIELRNAVSNYELSYVNEDNGAQISTNSSPNLSHRDIDSTGSKSPVEVYIQDIYETLSGLKDKINKRRRSKSIDAGCLSQLASISEERRKSSLLSTMSGLSEDVFASISSKYENQSDQSDKQTGSDDDETNKQTTQLKEAHEKETDSLSSRKQSDDEKNQQRKQFSKNSLNLLRRWSTASLLPLKKSTDAANPTALATATTLPTNTKSSILTDGSLKDSTGDVPTEKQKSRFSSNVLAAKILRRRSLPVNTPSNTTDLIVQPTNCPEKKTENPPLQRKNTSGKKTEDSTVQNKGTIEKTAKTQKNPEEKFEERAARTSASDSGDPSTNAQRTDERKNLVNTLKQKVKATLRRRNSIASAKPWTGTIERSMMSSFDLRPNRQESEVEDEEKRTNHTSVSSAAKPAVKTRELSNGKSKIETSGPSVQRVASKRQNHTVIANKQENINTQSINSYKKKGVEKPKDVKLLTSYKDTSQTSGRVQERNDSKKVSKSSGVNQTTNRSNIRKDSKTNIEKPSTPPVKKTPLRKTLSMSSLPIKKPPQANTNDVKRSPSPTTRTRRIGTTQPVVKSPVRSQTPTRKTTQEVKNPATKTVPLRPQWVSGLSSTSRDSKTTVQIAANNSSQEKNAPNLKQSQEKSRNVAKEEQKSSKTGKPRSNSFSSNTKTIKKGEVDRPSIGSKPQAAYKLKNSLNANKKNDTIDASTQLTTAKYKLVKTNKDKETTPDPASKKSDSKPANEEGVHVRNQPGEANELKQVPVNPKTKKEDIVVDTKKDEPERKTSVNVIRRPRSPFTITIQYKPNEHTNDNASIVGEQHQTGNQTGEIPGKYEKKPEPGKVHDQVPGKVQKETMSNTNDIELEKELDSFGLMLGELEKSASESVLPGKESSSKAAEVVPTGKRFAALSERYNVIMAKLTTRQHKKQDISDTTMSSEKAKPTVPDMKYDSKSIDTAPNDSEGKLALDETNHQLVVNGTFHKSKIEDTTTLDKNKDNFISNVSGHLSGDTVSSNKEAPNLLLDNGTIMEGTSNLSNLPQKESVLLAENAPSLFSQGTESSLFLSGEDVCKEHDYQQSDALLDSKVSRRTEAPVMNDTHQDLKKHTRSQINEGNGQINAQIPQINQTSKQSSVLASDMGPFSKEIANKEHEIQKKPSVVGKLLTSSEKSQEAANIHNERGTITRPDLSYEQIPSEKENREHKENRGRTESVTSNRKRSVTPSLEETKNTNFSHRRSHSFSLGRSDGGLLSRNHERNRTHTTSVRKSSLSSKDSSTAPENGITQNCSSRTTVIAKLMSRKLGSRDGMTRTVVARTSRIFKDTEIKDVPLNMEHFNKYRAQLEIGKLRSAVKSEAMSVHQILSSLNSSLTEMELIALCKECTRTLRTLDALGSLPSYLSPDTIMVNPSGTIKFRHLTTDIKIDDLFLAPDQSKKYSQSEKTCAFSLAVSLWLAADWKLTEAQEPSLSPSLQDLLVSMSNDSSTKRPGFDSILQTCELLQTDEMTSRERCQALLWECQATKVLDKQNVNMNDEKADEKTDDESNKTKAQHAALMGSVSVAANVKGFLKSIDNPTQKDSFTKEDQVKALEYEHRKPEPLSSSLNSFAHRTQIMDPNMVFSPINPVSGNPHLTMSSLQGSDMAFRNQAQAATPTFVPIAVPVPATGPSPVWYMTPTGMVPFSQMGQHPGYFVPLQNGSMSSTSSVHESDMNEMEEPVRRRSHSSTPTKSEKNDTESKRSIAPSGRSKIPRPARSAHKPSSPRPPSPSSNRTPRYDSHLNNSDKKEITTPTSLYRSNTPPIKLRAGGSESEREARRSIVGSSSPRSGERTQRPSSPRMERSRPSSPSFSGANSGSRPSSPVGSRSTSPVSLLISRFENISEPKSSDNVNAVSDLLNKFGSSSLLSEDRIKKRQFRNSSSQNAKTGPLRPSSAVDQTMSSSLTVDTSTGLSRSWSGHTQHEDASYDSDSIHSSPEKFHSPDRSRNTIQKKTSPLAQDETSSYTQDNRDPLSRQNRNKLISSLEDLYESLKEMDRNQPESCSLRRSGRNWASMENIYRADTESGIQASNPIRKSSSAENLSIRNSENSLDDRKSRAKTIYSEQERPKSWHREKTGEPLSNAETSYFKNGKTYKNDYGKGSEISDLFRKLDSKANIKNSDREIRSTTSYLSPERNYQLQYQNDVSTSQGRHHFEIPVSIAIMDNESEKLGHSLFSPTMFSPSAVKDKSFFQHPIKLEKDPAPPSPPAPLSPSVKDLRPTSYFSNLSFNNDEMKPERDTSSLQKRLKEKQSAIDSYHRNNIQKLDSTEMVDGDTKTEGGKPNRSKSRHSSSSGSSSSSSKVSSGYHSDFLERFEKRLSRKSSDSEEDLENPGSDHNFYSSATTKDKNDDEPSRTMNTNVNKEKDGRSKPKPISIPLTSDNSPSSSRQPSNSSKSTGKAHSSVPNTPTQSQSEGSSNSFDMNAPREHSNRGTASVPSTPNPDTHTTPFFKYVSPNSSPKKTNSRTVSEPTASVKETKFDFSERGLKENVMDSKTAHLNLKANLRTILSSPGSNTPGKRSSLELKVPMSPVEFMNSMSPTEPRSRASSSSSTASCSSPRFPVNKSIFYTPQSESPPERHLSPTEQVNSLGKKGFVITDTSRQNKSKKKEHKSKETPDFQHGGKLNLESSTLYKPEPKSEGIELTQKKQKPAGHASTEIVDIFKEESHKKDVNSNTVRKSGSNPERKARATEAKPLRKAAPDIPKLAVSPIIKDPKEVSPPAQGRRRGSIDLREIYHQARRSSLAARTDSGNSLTSIDSLQVSSNRPKSTSPQRPPSPGRVDSRELLGHFVKKMLNSTAKQSSPSSSHVDLSQKETTKIHTTPNTSQLDKQSPENTNKVSLHSKERKISRETEQRKSSQEEEKRKNSQGRKTSRETEQRKSSQEEEKRKNSQERKTSRETEQRKSSQEKEKRKNSQEEEKRKNSQERKHVRKESREELRRRRVSFENKEQVKVQEETKSHKRHPSLEDDVFKKDDFKERRSSSEKRRQAVQEKIVAKSTTPSHAVSKSVGDVTSAGKTTEDRRTSVQSTDEKDVLAKLIDMIHDEFAFDGYLDDGIEDVNMAEYVISLAGMDEAMFKESISDQYSDLYWDDDLLQDMYILVNKTLTSRRPTLRFSESNAGKLSRPGSSLSADSHQDLEGSLRSISRTSSERSFLETRDYVMSSLGEPSQFLPFKIIAPEMIRDIIDELGPVFEDYQKVMKIKLSPSISELLEKLGAKILEIGQQLTLERRAKKKNIASFNKVADVENKKDVKDLASKLLQEIEESDKTIIYLKHIQRRLRNIYAERFGLEHSLLNSFVNSYGEPSITLEPKRQNSCLSFSPLWDQRGNHSPECHGESTRGPVLQYGTNPGLMSYLFARHAMSQAYVRYFLYTYRYCTTANNMFEFIRDKCRASLRADSDNTFNHQLQIRYRALDLLAEWVHCCYQFDFKKNPDLLERLVTFLNDELIPVDRTERGSILIELISEKQRKEEQSDDTTDATAVLQTDENQGSPMEKDSPRKYKRKHKSPVQCFKRGTPQTSSTYKPTLQLKTMSVIDHSSRTIAEQLTLIQQDVFSRVHSIHFLNSRTLGVGVSRGSITKETSQQESMLGFSAGRRRSLSAESSPDTQITDHGLFEGEPITDGILEILLMHAQDVSMWIAVEICSAPSVKNQLVLIQKYISVAKYCSEMRNFATCVHVVDALDMFVIRQLPVWKQIPSKTVQTLDELKAVKVILKTDSTWLIKDNAYRERPTIPCSLLFLMHVQQLELGGFTLANGMYKWTKMRSIARLVDQIRLFKQMRYAFETNDHLAARLRARIVECREENLHALAADNAANFHLSSSQSSRKFQEAFKKMKATFGNG